MLNICEPHSNLFREKMFPQWRRNAGRDKFQEKKSLWVSEKVLQGPWNPRNSISWPISAKPGTLNLGILALEMHRRHHRTLLRKKLLVLQIGDSSSFYIHAHFQDKRARTDAAKPNSLDNPKLHLQRKPSVTGNCNFHHRPPARSERMLYQHVGERGG